MKAWAKSVREGARQRERQALIAQVQQAGLTVEGDETTAELKEAAARLRIA